MEGQDILFRNDRGVDILCHQLPIYWHRVCEIENTYDALERGHLSYRR